MPITNIFNKATQKIIDNLSKVHIKAIEESFIYGTGILEHTENNTKNIPLENFTLSKTNHTNKCRHHWKKTLGISKTYYDCDKCNIKSEDYEKEIGKKLDQDELDNKYYSEEFPDYDSDADDNIYWYPHTDDDEDGYL